ncbi:MAG: hypothetical protein IKU81_05940 [Oscillibacter sp.]|nr:hypothetical protein [Oscillibacter sp.]
MGTVMTVLGPMDSSQLGKTLSHEHIFCDFTCFLLEPKTPEDAAFMEEPVTLDNLWRMKVDPYSNRDECRLDSMETAVKEINWFKEAGGSTITEVSLEGSGRDVVRLAEVSRKTGVNIICATGHYIDPTLPDYVRTATEDQLTDQYIREIRHGIGDTGIRPGIIGEIGTSYVITPDEIKVLRAAARAQRETNLALTIHLDPGARRGHEVLDILIREEGVKPEKIILGHPEFALAHKDIDFYEGVDYMISLANRGCYVEFELCGNTTVYKKEPPLSSWVLPTDLQRTIAIRMLCNRGFSDRIVLSHDQGLKHFLRSYGGWGYSHVITDFQIFLAEAGIEPHIAKKFNVDNPARYLTFDE